MFSRFLDRLPPLLVLERILFRFITIGFVMLSLTAISGVFFSEAVFGRALRFDHKTVFTLISWFVFATLLVGRWRRGWRGRVALRLTFAGFAVLLLAYAGSRFVLEVLLHRY
ncbi:MAG: cytochrome c biogenesis protein CcsA [Burkholderiaceae bacterium]